MTDAAVLLREYLEGSEAAFEELVKRYANLVYSTALRMVGGDLKTAEDVAQTVFLHLARKAHRLPTQVMLGGWLHKDTCYVAATFMRAERRRLAREREAALMDANNNNSEEPHHRLALFLDEAIGKLGNQDRKAILLRFYEQVDFRSLGQALHTTEDAARMRVHRALDKLRTILIRQGVSISTTALATVLATQAVTAAPTGIVASISGAVLAKSATTGGIGLTVFKTITMSKLKLSLIGTVAVATVVGPAVVQYRNQVQIRAENQTLRQQLDQVPILQAETTRLSNMVEQARADSSTADANAQELAQLRGEVGRLRRENQEIKGLRQEVRNLGFIASPSQSTESVQSKDDTELTTTRVLKVDPTILGKLLQLSPAHSGEPLQDAMERLLEAHSIGISNKVRIVPDERRGVLVLNASQSDQELIEKLIADLSDGHLPPSE